MQTALDPELVRAVANTPPVFVAGNVRSGTTLVRSILDAHSSLSVTYETGLAVDACLTQRRGESMTETIDRIFALPGARFFDLPIDPEAAKEIVRGLEPADVVEAVRFVLALRAVANGKGRFGDKTPRYTFHLEALTELFPDCRIVLVVRDGREAAASGARTSEESGPARSILLDAVLWRASVRRSMRAIAATSPKQLCLVRLEDLRRDVEGTVRRLCDFVGEPFDDRMLAHAETARERLPMTDAEFSNLHSGVAADIEHRGSDWRRGVSPADASAVEVVLRRPLRRLGYGTGQRPTRIATVTGWSRVGLAVARELPAQMGSVTQHARRELGEFRHKLGV